MKRINEKQNKKGFTLVELVIVIAVIAILVAILIPSFSGVVDSAKQNAFLASCRNDLTDQLANEMGKYANIDDGAATEDITRDNDAPAQTITYDSDDFSVVFDYSDGGMSWGEITVK